MSIKIMSEIWEYSRQSGSALLVMLALADWSNDDGTCWYGQARLLRRARVQKRQLNYILAKCEQENEIARARRADQLTTVYAVICGVDEAEQKRRIECANVMPYIVQPAALVQPTALGVVQPTALGVVQPTALGVVQPTAPDPLATDPSIEPTDLAAKAARPLTAWQQQLKAMAEAICAVTGDDLNIDQTKKRVGSIAAQLLKAGYSPADLAPFHIHWKANDWRGKTGQAPTRQQVLEELPKFKRIAQKAAGSRKPDQASIDFVKRKQQERTK